MNDDDLTRLAIPGTTFDVRVTPRAGANRVSVTDGVIRVMVTAPADEGRANTAVVKLLAKAIGVPKSRLTLIRGQTARDKSFRVEP